MLHQDTHALLSALHTTGASSAEFFPAGSHAAAKESNASGRGAAGKQEAVAVIPVRILVVKWDRLFAETIQSVAREVFPGAAVVIAGTGARALAALGAERATIGIFGLTLPDMDGLDLLAAVLAGGLVEKSLVVSGRQDERVRVGLRQLGIDGFFDTENGGVELLRRAFREVAGGGYYFNNNAEPARSGDDLAPVLDRLLSITELQVFAIIGDGSDNGAAAGRLGMAEATVQTHRQHIMKKLKVQTRTDLMRVAIQRGIVRITRDRILRPGFEYALGERARSRDPFGKKND